MNALTVERQRLTMAEAEERAREIKQLREQGRKQREIASELGITRDLVAYYLSSNCKASSLAQSP